MHDEPRKPRWEVELRGTATRDRKLVEIAAWLPGEAMIAAVAAHPTYRVKSVTEMQTQGGS